MKTDETRALIEHYGRMFTTSSHALARYVDKAEMLEWNTRLRDLIESLPDPIKSPGCITAGGSR